MDHQSPHLDILGGGAAGLATAHYARRFGYRFRLFEKGANFGGLCRTLSLGPHRFDTGAHRFHDQDPEITSDLRELMGTALHSVSRPSRVLMSGKLVGFPPTPINMLLSAGVTTIPRIGIDLLRTRLKSAEIRSFDDFARANFGDTLAEKFLLNYTQKVWGLPPHELAPEVATRRLSGMNLRTLLKELLIPQKSTDHLDGSFLYPRGGYGAIPRKIVSNLPAPQLFSKHEITRLETLGDSVSCIHFVDRPPAPVEGHVVTTLPLSRLVLGLPDDVISPNLKSRARELMFRTIRLFFFRIDRKRFSEYASIYIPDPEFCISRISEPRNRCETMAPEHETGILVEVPCFSGDAIGRSSEEALCKRVVSELERLELVQPTELIDWKHTVLPNAYPVYSLNFAATVADLLKGLSSLRNLTPIGRNGLFHYSHLHDQFRFARDFVRSQLGPTEAQPVAAAQS